MANSPRIIPEARARLGSLTSSSFFRFGRSVGLKAMRCDYAEKIHAVLDTMLQSCTMQFDGALCRVSGDLARPYTVPEMARFSNLHQRTVERIIHDLKDMGLIQSERQFRRMFPNGLKVSAVWRVFTRLFWEKLGLWSLFVESVKYASEHGNLKLKNPVKLVGKKKTPAVTDDVRRRSSQNNLLFVTMVGCEHRRRGPNCPGGHQTTEICALCRKFPA